MHRLHLVAALYLDGCHRPPSTSRSKPRRQMQMAPHVFHLPKCERDPGSKKISKTGSQTAQLETHPVAIERNRAIEVLDQKTYIADRGPRYQLSHESA